MGSLAWVQDGTYSRKQLRQMLGALWGGKQPARPLGATSGLTSPVSLGVTSSTWTVGSFTGVLDVETDGTMGPSPFIFDGNTTGSVTAASGSFDRYDLLSLTMADPSTEPTIVYTAGSGATTLPAVPANSIALAQITVPQSGHGSPTITQLAKRAVAAGGVSSLLTAGSSLPSGPYDGQLVTDPINGLRRYNAANSSWNNGVTMVWQAHDATSLVTLADSVLTDLTLDTIDIDTAGLGLSGGMFTAPTDGPYLVSGVVRFPSNTTGARSAAAGLNGTATAASHTLYQTASLSHSTFVGLAASVIPCSAGDTISLQGFQDTGGGTLTVVAGSTLTVVRL